MKIHVRSRLTVVDESVRAHIERRVVSSLDRFADRVLRVTVTLLDVNGPRGGKDKVCRIEARMRPTGTTFVEAADADLATVIDRAADRAGASVARALKRDRRPRRSPAPSSDPARSAPWGPDDLDVA